MRRAALRMLELIAVTCFAAGFGLMLGREAEGAFILVCTFVLFAILIFMIEVKDYE